MVCPWCTVMTAYWGGAELKRFSRLGRARLYLPIKCGRWGARLTLVVIRVPSDGTPITVKTSALGHQAYVHGYSIRATRNMSGQSV